MGIGIYLGDLTNPGKDTQCMETNNHQGSQSSSIAIAATDYMSSVVLEEDTHTMKHYVVICRHIIVCYIYIWQDMSLTAGFQESEVS